MALRQGQREVNILESELRGVLEVSECDACRAAFASNDKIVGARVSHDGIVTFLVEKVEDAKEGS